MESEVLEKFYEKRLETILKQHCKMIGEDKKLSPIWKINHLNKIGEMLEIARRKVYTQEDLERE